MLGWLRGGGLDEGGAGGRGGSSGSREKLILEVELDTNGIIEVKDEVVDFLRDGDLQEQL